MSKFPNFEPFGNPGGDAESNDNDQYVLKRDGRKELVQFDKITSRIQWLCSGLPPSVSARRIAQLVIRDMPSNEVIKTSELDVLAYRRAAVLAAEHPGYDVLAARIGVNNHHKNTSNHKSFSETMKILYNNNGYTHKGKPVHHISDAFYKFVMKHANTLNQVIVYDRDYLVKYSGFKTLEDKYFLRVDGVPVERQQHVLMRLSVQFYYPLDFTDNSDDSDAISNIIDCYQQMSYQLFTHASPTLFNAGTPEPQMASCFLLSVDDSVKGMYGQCLPNCAEIAKGAGGIGIDVGNVRAVGSKIRSTDRESRGVLKYIQVLDKLIDHINQGGRRNASIAIYIPPWHPEIENILRAKRDQTIEENRANRLFYALWISDLFMERVKNDQPWSLFCPDECPGLQDAYGDDFKKLYEKYEQEGRARETVQAQKLWEMIVEIQIETGGPYILYKDHINRKSNQSNLGTIYCSNLCSEIVEYARPDEIAVCNLASAALPKFVKYYDDEPTKGYFDYSALHVVTKLMVRNLNQVIDRSFYPADAAKRSNLKHRPIGIGVSGLADAFIKMRFPFESDEARELNRRIFETMYHGAIEASCELAEKYGPYETYEGSPMSKGKFQFDLWADAGHFDLKNLTRDDWPELKEKVRKYGVRNSLLIAIMPTATTSFIIGHSESIEPRQSNLFRRQSSTNEFVVANEYMAYDLLKLGLWTEQIRNEILQNGGSIRDIKGIPDQIKELYKTVWEIKQRTIIDLAADRGPFVCQTQSMNLYIANPTTKKISSALFYAWDRGLKTGSYYMRTQAVQSAICIASYTPGQSKDKEKDHVNLDVNSNSNSNSNSKANMVCTDEICTSCAL